jgi:alpha-tubulin suppressor-like RCC1 family protein
MPNTSIIIFYSQNKPNSVLDPNALARVGTGEYATIYGKNDGTVYTVTGSEYTGFGYSVVQIPGLSNIVQLDGGQYNTLARSATGQVYTIPGNSTTVTSYPLDDLGNPFTCDYIQGFYAAALALKNGELWYWNINNVDGREGVADILNQGYLGIAPKKLIQPVGKTLTKIVSASATSFGVLTYVLALASDGTVWKWDRTHTTPFEVTGGWAANSVIDLALVGPNAYVIVTNTNQIWAWGYLANYVGGTASFNEGGIPQNITTLWTNAGVNFPIKKIVGTYNTLHIIDANDELFGAGSNVQGNIGNGVQTASWRTNSPPYAWSFANNILVQGPLQIQGKWKNIVSNNSVVFYLYGQDMNNNWYSWGRNKAEVLGNGVTVNSFNAATYPEFYNIPAPRLVTPLSQSWSILPVNINVNRNPIANAGINQYLTSSTTQTTLYGTGSHQQQPTNSLTVTMAYNWTKTSGPTCTITSPTSQNTTVTDMTTGTYVFKLNVTSSNTLTDFREVTVSIGSFPTLTPTPTSTPTTTPTSTPTTTPTPTPTTTPTSTPTTTPTSTPTITPTPTSTATSTPTPTPTSSYDADAQAYFDATGITDNTIQNAVNTLVLSLKFNGLWEKGKIINPVAGGTATTHKFNLKDPRDLNAAYRLTFSGTVTHSSNGMVGNGSNGYANTFLNPNTVYPTTGLMSLGIYLNSATNIDEIRSDIGAISGATNYCQIYAKFDNTFYGQINIPNNVNQRVTNTDSRGWFFASRTGATAQFIQKNLVRTSFNGAPNQSVGMVNNNIFVMAQSNTAGNPSLYSTKRVAFVWVGDSLSTTEADNLYTIIQTYQTSLSRHVGTPIVAPTATPTATPTTTPTATPATTPTATPTTTPTATSATTPTATPTVTPTPPPAGQFLTTVNGWNAYVHLPDDYNSNPSTYYPTIIFIPGLNEVGLNRPASRAILNGPGAYITQGWNGNVTVSGTTVKFIVISLQPNSEYPRALATNTRISTLKSTYRIDTTKMHLTGLSHGAWVASIFVTSDALGGPFTYAGQVASVVNVQGVKPEDNQPYPNLFDNFADVGGRYLGFEQTQDGRDIISITNRMNARVPNSGIFVSTNFGNGDHCCWERFYGGQGVEPTRFTLDGISQNIYEWMAKESL